MAFPPDFLDELRRRLPLSGVVGRRVKLVRKGREFTGLCPFHNEKSPSFFVNDDKAFYHCFGCGAHGDAITFVMNTEGLEFPEAVDRLASQAGLEVPHQAPADPREKQRRQTIEAACEAACIWFEKQLWAPSGREALGYLRRRGVGEDQIGAFRLGWAPDERHGLKGALLAQGFPEALLIEAGLLIKVDERPDAYDRFRGRVMFTIMDRGGKPVGFGGRLMGDGQPKYLNSPETPLFHKGRSLYAHHVARATTSRGQVPVVVVEGYMDVIALHRAGFTGAVAPLGTALTEDQLAELWRMADEPVLCFDGDAAGQRAARRALERALPLLTPGRSLRFVTLPGGQDPDDLVSQPGGAVKFGELLSQARPLVDMLWQVEAAEKPQDTPERRAAFRQRLRELAASIQDRDVREAYQQDFQARQAKQFQGDSPAAPARRVSRPRPGRWAPPPDPFIKDHPQSQVREHPDFGHLSALLLALIHHPFLIEEVLETLAEISLGDVALDSFKQEIVNTAAALPGLDAATLQTYLAESGQGSVLAQIAHRDIAAAYPFARPDAAPETVRRSCLELLDRLAAARIAEDLEEVRRQAVETPTEENWRRFKALAEAGLRARHGTVDED